jgi:hypothetical protein
MRSILSLVMLEDHPKLSEVFRCIFDPTRAFYGGYNLKEHEYVKNI